MNPVSLPSILIVDDEAENMRALCATLREKGYDTEGFTAGKDALAALRQRNFDLLLTDLMMPGMDGLALLTAALALDPHTVGILMTGKGTIETAVAAMKAGALDYVLKPIKLNAILPVLSRALSVRRLRLENLELRDTVAIHELNQAIAHTLDPQVLLQKIADAALEQFQGDEASVMLVSDAGGDLEVVAVRGDRQLTQLGTRVATGEGVSGRVAAERKPVLLDRALMDPGVASSQLHPAIQSVLSMPMITRDKLIGILNVNFTTRPRLFSPGQIKVLGIFTNTAAAGIEASRLYEVQRRTDARYREVLGMAADGIMSMDGEQRIVIFNAAAEEIFGYRAEEVLGKPLDMLLPQVVAMEHRRMAGGIDNAPELSRKVVGRRQLFGRRKDGTLFHAEVGISKRAENHELLLTVVVQDISQRVFQEEKIARLSRIQSVLSGINAAIVRIRDQQQLFHESCRIAVEDGRYRMAWIGLAEPDLGKAKPVSWMGIDEGYLDEVGLKLKDVTQDHGAGGRALREKRPIVINDIETSSQVVFKKEALAHDYHSLAALPLLVEDRAIGVMALYSRESNSFTPEEMKLLAELAGDIAFALEVMKKEEQLAYLANHDVLTGLPNRSLFTEQLNQRVHSANEESKRFAVVVLDLERFRNINETLGRQVGDAVLRQMGQRLSDAMGKVELLAHFGIDQFAIGTRPAKHDEANMARIVERIIVAALGRPFETGNGLLQLSARAGIAVFPADGADSESLCRNAEAALREAKRTGQKYQFYAPKMNAAVAKTMYLENRLRGALQRSEFILHYQPKVDFVTGNVVGLEALIRWQDPETGLVPPLQFIPLLEETGLIVQTGDWAIKEALRAVAALRARGIPPVHIAVNVSAVELQQKDYVHSVAEAIAAAGGEPHCLDLEITESVVMHDIDDSVRKLSALRAMGVELAIDDFGTGYSSLAYIGRLPVSVIKIDRAFVRNLKDDADSMSIVQTIISLTHALNRKVVAEGVETQEQAQLLRLLRCDQYQGYLFSKPVALTELDQLLLRSPAP